MPICDDSTISLHIYGKHELTLFRTHFHYFCIVIMVVHPKIASYVGFWLTQSNTSRLLGSCSGPCAVSVDPVCQSPSINHRPESQLSASCQMRSHLGPGLIRNPCSQYSIPQLSHLPVVCLQVKISLLYKLRCLIRIILLSLILEVGFVYTCTQMLWCYEIYYINWNNIFWVLLCIYQHTWHIHVPSLQH